MSWQEPKVDWTNAGQPSYSDFNRVEGNTLVVRETETLPICVEVLADFPEHAAGRVFYHSVHQRIYTSTGTAWV